MESYGHIKLYLSFREWGACVNIWVETDTIGLSVEISNLWKYTRVEYCDSLKKMEMKTIRSYHNFQSLNMTKFKWTVHGNKWRPLEKGLLWEGKQKKGVGRNQRTNEEWWEELSLLHFYFTYGLVALWLIRKRLKPCLLWSPLYPQQLSLQEI